MSRIVNDTFANVDISTGASVYQYTIAGDGSFTFQVYLDSVVGGANDYIAWIQKQRGGAGVSYPMLPLTTGTGIAGWAEIAFTTIAIECVAGDVIDIYIDGQAGDVAVDGKVEIFRTITTLFTAGAIEYTYTVTNSVTTNPIEGVDVWISTAIGGANIIWRGQTDAFGVARDSSNQLPFLDAGTYYFWCQRSGYSFTNPDTETVAAGDTTGETTGTPIAATAGSGAVAALDLGITTLLSLHRYAQIMGLDPLHFAQGYSSLRPLGTACSDIWFQYDWQDGDKVSRDQILRLIADAERDIADAVGYWPAPVWTTDERHPYPAPHDIAKVGTSFNSRAQHKSVKLDYGYVIEGGQRAASLLGTASYTTLDADGDSYDEWAVFTLTVPSTIAECEVQAYFKEYSDPDSANTRTDPGSTGADDTWRIRPCRVSISGTTMTAYIPRWELFAPYLQRAMSVTEIDADDATNYVDEVVFYRVYNDPQDQVLFGWANEVASCDSPACAWGTQDGCMKVRNVRNADVVVQPSTWDSVDQEFDAACWAEDTEPQLVWVSYYSGYQRRVSGYCDNLDDWWARVIAYLATSRLDVNLCTCANVAQTVEWLREDTVRVNRNRSFSVTPDQASNPFGTRRGEVWAWDRIRGHGKGRTRRRGRGVRI